MHNLVNLFCHVDDFCQNFMPHWQIYLIERGERRRLHQGRMAASEIMTIIICLINVISAFLYWIYDGIS
ncbi:transposase [Xenorhabdus mauleonii]|uniref:Transposase n=1 Tax=Xenorhabdus mauleonii TaxID=351675 RepID=A0A1I3WSX5_9GAMM|nr:transposase [Xenorhabdus mauleonii]SFK10615.1 hypothetical protein SAMN05421680_12922 [Xenorhabdus mauleonii]